MQGFGLFTVWGLWLLLGFKASGFGAFGFGFSWLGAVGLGWFWVWGFSVFCFMTSGFSGCRFGLGASG